MYLDDSFINDILTLNRRRSNMHEIQSAELQYEGAPNSNDDPADYYIYPKGVRLA